MMTADPRVSIAIVGMGAISSVGLYPESIAAAVAGGIGRARVLETMRHAQSGAPIRLALAPTMTIHFPIRKRLLELGQLASRQALAPLLAVLNRPRLAILLSMPREHRGLSAASLRSTAKQIAVSLPVEPITELSSMYRNGHDGGVSALARARALLATGQADICLVGGVESYCDADALEVLANANRLKNDDSPTGLTPGEGAAFLVVMRSESAAALGLPRLAQVLQTAYGHEPNPWHSGRSTQARGLTTAIAGAFEGQPPSVVAHATYCDASGEHWRADEWSFAYLRTAARHADPLDIRHPAECWGDVGAASALLLLVTAVVDARRYRVRGPHILVFCASDQGPSRGAVLIEAQAGGT